MQGSLRLKVQFRSKWQLDEEAGGNSLGPIMSRCGQEMETSRTLTILSKIQSCQHLSILNEHVPKTDKKG
jgi:hypothetical protein